MESNLHLQIKCAPRASRPRSSSSSPGREGEGERKRDSERVREGRGVDYRDEEEVDGVVTAGGSCKIKRRLLLC